MPQKEQEILESLIPQAVVESITFETNRSGDSEGIVVKVVYSLSETVERDAISLWFDQIAYEKYFSVRTELVADGILETHYDTPALTTSGDSASGRLIESMDNSRVSLFRFEKTYSLPTTPEDLSFTVVSSFDIFSLERDFDIDLFRAEQRDTERSERIVIISNNNLQYPIQDFRIREELKKFKLPTERSQEFEYLSRQVSIKKELDTENATDFFSDFWLTRNAQGEAKFMFIFNAASFFEKRSRYKSIFNRLNAMEKYTLIRDLSIPSLKIKRKRVKVLQDNRGREVVDFTDQLSLSTIVETGKRSNQDTFSRVVSDKASVMQVSITGISTNPLDDNNLVFITGTDYDIAKATDGAYCYGVFIEVIDTTRTLLLGRLTVLNERISLIKSVLVNSRRAENYDSQTDFYKKSLEEIVSDETISRKFKSAKDLVKRTYRTFIGNTSSDENTMINRLFRMDSIKSPTELEMIIEIMETLLKNSASSIGESQDHYSGLTNSSATDVRITAEKFYTSPAKVFDANVPKLEGMEYLANFNAASQESVIREITSLSSQSSDVGLRVIDGGEWEGRIESEIDKFFESGTRAVSLPVLNSTPGTSSVSLTGPGSKFLTVSAVLGTGNQVSVFNGINDTIASAAIIRNDTINGINTRLSGTPMPPSTDDRPAANYLAKSGVAFSGISSNPLRRRHTLTADALRSALTDEGTDERAIQENFEEYIFDKVSKQRRDSLLVTGIVSSANLRDTTVTQASPLSNLSPQQQRQEFEGAPNQTISYATLGGELNEAAFVVSSEFLTKISYLSGFEVGDTGDNVCSPKWSDLSLDVYRNNSERNLLCRIKPYHKSSLGIRASTKSSLPTYDAYFIIRPEPNFMYETTELVSSELRVTEADRQRNIRLARLRQELLNVTETLNSSIEDRALLDVDADILDTRILEVEREIALNIASGNNRGLREMSIIQGELRGEKSSILVRIRSTDRMIDFTEHNASEIRLQIREIQSETT